MDDKTLQALEKLAQKMGVTTEHLWGVLIAQAPVSAGIEIAAWLVLVATCVVLSVKVAQIKGDGDNVPKPLLWVGVGLLAGIALLVAGINASSWVAAFSNPEYWALHDILGAMRSR